MYAKQYKEISRQDKKEIPGGEMVYLRGYYL